MKGVLLAGGTGSRLHPLTRVTNKHLMPVFDRPMIYFPLETLRGMGIEKVMVILGGRSIGDIVELLSDGHEHGLDLTYRFQRGSLGIAHAIGLTREFVGDDSFCVVLGDNILQGDPLADVAQEFEAGTAGAGTLLYRVPDAQRFGVAEFDANGELVGFEEKPENPKSELDPHRRVLHASRGVRGHRGPSALRPGRVRGHRRPQPLPRAWRALLAPLRRAMDGRRNGGVAAARESARVRRFDRGQTPLAAGTRG